MDRNRILSGQMDLLVTCADISGFLNSLILENVHLVSVTYCDDLTIKVTIKHRDYQKVCAITDKFGGTVKVLKKIGLQWKLKAIRRRPVLLACGLIFIIFFSFLQSKVLFLQVDGNHIIPDKQILEAAESCGIRFGASRRKIRSEIMKNELLQKIPQLQWAGINTSGCIATISVREKTEPEEAEEKEKQVTSIVALRDGIIQNCTVYQGNPLCSVGQAVKEGQTLVSGYTDCGIITKATQAQAEIHALTFRQLEIITPRSEWVRGEYIGQKTKYSIRIGKKVIKFFKDSGNFTPLCAKIYVEECWQLPGGYSLPVAIIKETTYTYEQGADTSAISEAEAWLEDFAKTYLQSTMIAGEVLSSKTETEYDEAVCNFNGKYACREMIGKIRVEQGILGEDTND